MDLSCDEGGMQSEEEDQVWSFNEFMEHYNQLYTWLNQIQDHYNTNRISKTGSRQVEGVLAVLNTNFERRNDFVANCGKMVASSPCLGKEVEWRVEHVLAKWDMLNNLKSGTCNINEDVSFIYSGKILFSLGKYGAVK